MYIDSPPSAVVAHGNLIDESVRYETRQRSEREEEGGGQKPQVAALLDPSCCPHEQGSACAGARVLGFAHKLGPAS